MYNHDIVVLYTYQDDMLINILLYEFKPSCTIANTEGKDYIYIGLYYNGGMYNHDIVVLYTYQDDMLINILLYEFKPSCTYMW